MWFHADGIRGGPSGPHSTAISAEPTGLLVLELPEAILQRDLRWPDPVTVTPEGQEVRCILARRVSRRGGVERRGYYREKIAVGPKRAGDAVTRCVLRPLPTLEGRVVAGDAELPVSGASLQFDSREMHAGFCCDEEGRFSLQLLPGGYRLRISVPAPAEEEEGATQKKPEERVRDSLVLSTDFTMPGKSMTREFLVPECVEVGIEIGFAPAMATPQKCVVLVLEAQSMRRITRALLQGGVRRFNLPAGRYKVAVVTEGMRGVVAGEISVKKGDTGVKSVTIAKPWEACHVEDDEVVTFSPAREHQKTDGKDAQEH